MGECLGGEGERVKWMIVVVVDESTGKDMMPVLYCKVRDEVGMRFDEVGFLTHVDKLDIGRSKGVGIYASLFCFKAGVVAGTARQAKRKILTAVSERISTQWGAKGGNIGLSPLT